MLKKRWLTLFVLLLFLLSSGTVLAANQVFEDVADGHWAVKDIARMKAKGLVNGVSATSFAPSSPVTLEQLVVMLVRALDVKSGTVVTIPTSYTQRNNVSDYAISAMAYAVKEGVISDELLQSNPKEAVKRHEVAVLVGRAMGLTSEAEGKKYQTLDYQDATAIPLAARGYVALMQDKGIMGGSDDGNFNPNSSLTRAEFATILNRIDSQLNRLTSQTLLGEMFSLSVSSSSITIKDKSGSSQMIALADDPMIFKNDKVSSLINLTSGATVEIIKDAQNKAVYIAEGQFDLKTDTIKGKISSLVAGQEITVITIDRDGGGADTYTLSKASTIRMNNQAITAGQLEKGQAVTAVAKDGIITSLDVTDNQRVINGTIKEIDRDYNKLVVDETKGLGNVELAVDDDSVIVLKSKTVEFADLVEGMEVMVIARGNTVTRIDAQHLEKSVGGVLVDVSLSPDITITILNDATKKEETYKVDGDADIRRDRQKNLSLREIFAGDEVDVDLKNRVAVSIYAVSAKKDDLEGLIKEIRLGVSPVLVIETKDGKQEQYLVSSNARIRKDGVTVDISELKYMDWVELKLEGNQAIRIDAEVRNAGRCLVGIVAKIHDRAVNLIEVIENETNESRKVFWNDDTAVIRDNRLRSVSNLSAKDEVVVVGYYDEGLFWARTIVIID
jgi:predicted RNA-binding protein